MYKLDPKYINFDEKLCSDFTSHIYPYQKTPNDNRYIVKHIMAHDADELLLHMQEIIFAFNAEHPSLVPIKGYYIEKIRPRGFNLYMKIPRYRDNLNHLFERLRKEKRFLNEDEIVQIFYSLVCGLESLHKKKVVHKDLKPSYIFLDENGRAKISGVAANSGMNFGEAPLFKRSAICLYKPPEMQGPDPQINKKDLPKVDVWSLGVIMAELCLLQPEPINFSLQNSKKMETDIQRKIMGLEGRYSKPLLELLLELLRYHPGQRKNLSEVKSVLENNYASILGIQPTHDFGGSCSKAAEQFFVDINNDLMLIEEAATVSTHVSTHYEERKLEEESQSLSTPQNYQPDYDLLKQELENKWKSIIKFNPDKEFGMEVTNYSRVTDDTLKKFIDDLVKRCYEKNAYGLSSFDLNLYGCDKLTDLGVRNLAVQVGTYFQNLQHLTLNFPGTEQITDQSLQEISTHLIANLSDLKTLALNFNFCRQLTDQGVIAIGGQIGRFKSLQHLTLNLHFCERVTDHSLKAIAAQIGQNLRGLEHLSIDLAGCRQVSDTGLGELAEQLSLNLGTLQNLTLSFAHSDQITDQGITELAIYIGQNLQNLTTLMLDLGGCDRLTDQSIMELAVQIGANLHGLQQLILSLSGCKQISDSGMKEFGVQISSNCENLMLLCLNLIQTPITFSLKSFLKEQLSFIPSSNIHF